MDSIVSLLPSGTEWVYALGLQNALAGVTFECDHPASARTRHPVVVHGLPTDGMTPGEIDAVVRSRVARGEPLYELDVDAMARIAPDVVLTQDLCQVCALPAGQVATAVERVGHPARLVTLDPHRLDEVLDGAGSVVAAAGGEAILADPGGRSVSTGWPAISSLEPDITVIAPCGFGLGAAMEQGRAVLDRLPPRSEVWAVDAGAFVTRPGPRTVDGVEALAHVLHAESVGAPPPGRVARLRPF